jgi:uncharacterized protein (DUF302 family)
MIQTWSLEHHEHVTDDTYEEVMARFMAVTGSVEEGFDVIAKHIDSKESFQSTFKEREGSSGFMRFMVVDHGAWLTRFYDQPTKATMIVLGNPLIAITMLQQDLRAGLNVPTRIYIYAGPSGQTHIVYDLPSTQMGDLTEEAQAAAKKLDEKLIALATSIAGQSSPAGNR